LPDLRPVDGAGGERRPASFPAEERRRLRKTHWVHRICHHKLHSLFAERELARLYATPAAVRAHPEMQCFIP
jgi:hypothetical protein